VGNTPSARTPDTVCENETEKKYLKLLWKVVGSPILVFEIAPKSFSLDTLM
jgi:hypothetical protein